MPCLLIRALVVCLGLSARFAAAADKSPVKCYVCIGYDFQNGKHTETQCDGVCWKVTDRDQKIIAKGCSSKTHDLTSEEADFATGVRLPSANNAEIKGNAVFCKTDFCNGASVRESTFLLLTISLLCYVGFNFMM